jgi:hypothetical protein
MGGEVEPLSFFDDRNDRTNRFAVGRSATVLRSPVRLDALRTGAEVGAAIATVQLTFSMSGSCQLLSKTAFSGP